MIPLKMQDDESTPCSSAIKVCQVCAVEFTFRKFLAPLAAALAQEGYQVHGAFSPEHPGSSQALQDLKRMVIHPVVIARSASPLALARSTWQLFRLFRRERFTVVHVHTPVAAIAGRLAASLARVPLVIYTAISLEALLARLTTELFTVSNEDAAFARRLRFKRAGHIHAIGNGVDPSHFLPPTPEQRRFQRHRLGLDEDAVVIGIVARLVAEKGYGELCEAFSQLAPRYPQMQLLFCGSRLASDHAGAVDQLVRDLQRQYPEQVVCTGDLEDPKAAYQAMDIFCLPSWREGLPYTVIEAMLSALPVTATDIRGCREQVLPEITGLLVPPAQSLPLANALERLLLDPERRRTWGAAGRARALELYDQSVVLERQLALYRRALGRLPHLSGQR
jgi:glycosyltransferase involved in cell wall biosynthesis